MYLHALYVYTVYIHLQIWPHLQPHVRLNRTGNLFQGRYYLGGVISQIVLSYYPFVFGIPGEYIPRGSSVTIVSKFVKAVGGLKKQPSKQPQDRSLSSQRGI